MTNKYALPPDQKAKRGKNPMSKVAKHQTVGQPPTPEQISAEQKRTSERDQQMTKAALTQACERQQEREHRAAALVQSAGRTAAQPVPAKPNNSAMAIPDNRSAAERYVDEVAPSGVVGRLIKFSKEGTFITNDDGEEIDEAAEFIALCDQTLVGFIKFNGPDTPPDRIQGLLYDNFIMPPREALGDLDQSRWDIGLNGQPEDPWKSQSCLVLQHTDTAELFTFATTSPTGRRAVGNLLRHFNRTQKTNPNELPVVRLKTGGYNHPKFGWVNTPVFVVVGKTSRDNAAKPDTSLAGDMQDEIPF